MRTLHQSALLFTVAVFAASCGGGGAQPSDELLRDLDAAQASSIELAARVQDYQPTKFVTAVEQLPVATPSRARAPRRVYNPPRVADVPQPEVSTPTPEPAQEIVQTPVPEPEAPTEVSAVPSVVARPAATPASPAPSGDAETGRSAGPSRGELIGTIIGEAIGVVIRGGPVGPGHCPPRGRRGRPGIILPLEMPLVRPDLRR